jgi:Zn-dependent alcohol dehydrogenase
VSRSPIETVDLEGPRAGEVLVEIMATGICHTDEFTRSGADPEGLFPAILGTRAPASCARSARASRACARATT